MKTRKNTKSARESCRSFDTDTVMDFLDVNCARMLKSQPIRTSINPNTKENNIEDHLLANNCKPQVKTPTARSLSKVLYATSTKQKAASSFKHLGCNCPVPLKNLAT